MIELKGIEKIYNRGNEKVHALRGIDLGIGRGEFMSVVGPSGSGKTTLLHLLGCLDTPTGGTLTIDGIEVVNMRESELVRIRRSKIGFVFQHFYLIPGLSVYENVKLPLLFGRTEKKIDEIVSLIDLVGLKSRLHHTPNQLSGGEMQRVAIARALVNNPEFILADEPTGNLDTENSEKIFELLDSLHKRGIALVLVTHNSELAARAERIIRLKDGRLQGSD
ncbi:MAG: ABC transporter ATP-binding protein [Nitrospira sp.]|nr:ABC transporter ATP-binding protein [Nitrospira sp.]